MRRNARSIISIVLVIVICSLILTNQEIKISNFERGSDAILGLSLGLDLQGGSHLVYQSDLFEDDKYIQPTADQMQSLVKTIERRINSSGLGVPIIQILGEDRLLIQLPGIKDPSRAKDLIGETARLEFKHRTFDTTAIPVTEILPQHIESISTDFLRQDGKLISQIDSESLQNSELEKFEAIVVEFSEEGSNIFNVIGGEIREDYIKSLQSSAAGNAVPPSQLVLNFTGNEEFSIPVTGNQIVKYENTNKYIFSIPALPDADGNIIPLESLEIIAEKLGNNPSVSFQTKSGMNDEDIGLTGDDLNNAYPNQQQGTGKPIVNIEFNENGTKIFGDLTTQIYSRQQETGVQDRIAIILDGKELIAPSVKAPITAGTAFIDGPDFTIERVRDLALLLESGRLPIPIKLIQERDVDAILGAESLQKSVIAGSVGLLLVLLFMTLYYRLPGIIAALALIIYSIIVLSIFKILPVTLTLSGVAAAILSIGMAVDANILIFERMKDELRIGRTLLTSINTGFNRAWPAIRDGNVSTLITCAILYWFSEQLGATIVQGFAATLAIGVSISMISAIFVSRTLMRLLALSPISKNISLFIPHGGGEISKKLKS